MGHLGASAATVLAVTAVVAALSRPGSAAAAPTADSGWPSAVGPHPRVQVPAAAPPSSVTVPHAASPRLLLSSRPLAVTAPVRLLVFAPHPDDETIAAGGLMQRVLATGGTVAVVVVTNGDGYVDGVRKTMRRTRTSAADFVRYGRQRQQEARRALRALGLQPRDGIFLGFPDDGIDDLWARHWSPRRPFRSPHTHFDRPKYRGRPHPQLEYSGSDLDTEVGGILDRYRPDWVLIPDPRDWHPDHCTTGVFVLDALRKLRQSNPAAFTQTQVFTYLVHYPNYPASPAWMREITGAGVGGSSTAGRELSVAPWLSLRLSPAEEAGKRRALAHYETQLQVMHPFLQQFLHEFELFGQLDAAQVAAVPRQYAARFRPSR